MAAHQEKLRNPWRLDIEMAFPSMKSGEIQCHFAAARQDKVRNPMPLNIEKAIQHRKSLGILRHIVAAHQAMARAGKFMHVLATRRWPNGNRLPAWQILQVRTAVWWEQVAKPLTLRSNHQSDYRHLKGGPSRHGEQWRVPTRTLQTTTAKQPIATRPCSSST